MAIALVRRLTGLSQNQAKQLFELGKVHVDGKVCTAWSTAVVRGQIVDVDTDRKRLSRQAVLSADAVRFLDETLVVVEKPHNVVSVPPTRTGEPTLLELLRRQLGEPRGSQLVPVHRLDFGTSGLMVFGFRGAHLESLMRLVSKHLLDRRYLAVVAGVPPSDLQLSGQLDVTRERFGGKQRHQWAGTSVTVVRQSGGVALLECRPETGRFHQIRKHLAEAGYPILGDAEHAPAGFVWPARSPRLALHSWFLSFVHPATSAGLTFESPLPIELERLLD